MKYLTILPALIYIALVWHKYGIQKSISESYYRLTTKQQPYFWASLTITSFAIIFVYLHNHFNILSNILLILAGSGICYSAAAAFFKDSKVINTVHTYGASLGYAFGYLFLISVFNFDSVWFVVPSFLLMWIIYKINKKNYVWWFEIIGMITIWIGTLI